MFYGIFDGVELDTRGSRAVQYHDVVRAETCPRKHESIDGSTNELRHDEHSEYCRLAKECASIPHFMRRARYGEDSDIARVM